MDYPTLEFAAGFVAALIAATFGGAAIARVGFPLPRCPRIGCIDGLRGYLALAVLASHFSHWMRVTRSGTAWGVDPSLRLLARKLFEENQFGHLVIMKLLVHMGASAVGLFFMTTGFLFYPRVLAGFRASWWPVMITGRVFRIVPLVVVSVGLVTAIIAIRTGHGLDAGYPKAAALWITGWSEPPLLGDPNAVRLNAGVLWSLWYEWVFYLAILPACALAMDLVRGRYPSWIVPAALLLGTYAEGYFFRPRGPLSVFLPVFAVGMLAYECHRRERIARWLRTPAATAVAVVALAVGLCVFSSPYCEALPMYGFFFTCVACGNDIGGLLRTRGALVLGECSYGIYLLHGIVLSLLFVDASALTGRLTVVGLPALLPLAALAALIFAAISHLLVERPAIRLGRRLVSRAAGLGAKPGVDAAATSFGASLDTGRAAV